MSKERYIKIGDGYFPIDSMCWAIISDGRVCGFEVSASEEEPTVIVEGEDASNLIALLDEMSFDLKVASE
jgi:hypothetical protein